MGHSVNDALKPADFEITSLGPCNFDSPLRLPGGEAPSDFVSDAARVLLSVERLSQTPGTELSFQKAGPRRKIYFDPSRTRAGIVTCGGLCPGINSVIRSVVLELHHLYGVRDILGFRFGYEGLNPERGLPPVPLSPGVVQNIHRLGGSVLGLGRGTQDPACVVSYLAELGVNILLTVGGDGTLKGARAIAEFAARGGFPLSVVGVPKTIDNDIAFVDQTFGFETAVQVAAQALDAAHTEATSARNGVGVVKLMGREAGFISAHAALASLDVNFCLIPEVPFDLEGKGGLFEALEARLLARGHALIVVSEGCGLALGRARTERDAPGNLRFASRDDVGPPLCEAIRAHFKARSFPIVVRYIDPSYMIRSVAANASDNEYCDLLARHAVHAAMAGKTSLVIGRWNGYFTHVPLALSTTRKKRVDARSELWLAVTSTTGQPSLCRARSLPESEGPLPERGASHPAPLTTRA
jgi:6-phosphofructokinase 1